MRQLIIPWLATFLFGLVVFAIGKVLQFGEMKKRAQRKAEIEREKILADVLAQSPKQQEHELVGIMAAAAGSGQRSGRRQVN
jgi:hypothetical protein